MTKWVVTGVLIGVALAALIVVNQLNNGCGAGPLQYKMTAPGEACERPEKIQTLGLESGSKRAVGA